MIPQIVQQGLGPLVYWSLQRQGFLPDQEPVWKTLGDSARQAAIQYALLESSRQRLASAFAQSGIPAIWLKGIALARTVYPEVWLRPMGDLDVLVPHHKRHAARQAAMKLGFQRPEMDYLDMIGAPEQVRYQDQLNGGTGDSICLEIHFRLLGLEQGVLLSDRHDTWFWQQTQEAGRPEVHFTMLKPEAHLLYLCAHAVLRHRESYQDLLHLYDLHLLIQGGLDWRQVVESALALNWSWAVERGLRRAVEAFGGEAPEWVLSDLREWRTEDEKRAILKFLRLSSPGWEKWKLAFHALPLRGQIHMLWKTIFPPASFLREVYHPPPSRLLLPYYIKRWWERGGLAARSIWNSWRSQNTNHELY